MTVTKILFVCHGNICRSPMAEFVMKRLVKEKGLEDEFEIASVATSTEEIWNGKGNPVYPSAKAIMAEHGIDCSGKCAVQIKKADGAYYDYIVGMDDFNFRNIKRMIDGKHHHKISLLMDNTICPRSVADPWYTGDFQKTWQDVNEGCTALLKNILDTK